MQAVFLSLAFRPGKMESLVDRRHQLVVCNISKKNINQESTTTHGPLWFSLLSIACLQYIAERISDAGHYADFFVKATVDA